MTTVRPPVWPTVQPPATSGAGAGRANARGAFFEQALGRATDAQPTAQAAQAAPVVRQETAPQPHAERVRTTFTQPSEEPRKILRPGSFIDIRV